MKRIVALIICLALALSVAAAETAAPKTQLGTLKVRGAFALQCALPEGYTLETIENEDSYCHAVLKSVDGTKPELTIRIAFNEMASGLERLNDASDEAIANIEATFRAEDTVDISYMETAHGTKIMVVKEVRDNVDFVDFYTIYKGYEVEIVLHQVNPGDAGITDDQIQMAIDFLSDLDFIEA